LQDKHPLPKRAGITTVHKELEFEVQTFLGEMHKAKAELPTQVDWTAGPASESLLRFVRVRQTCQMYSRAVQVFAFLSVEAFLNEYGYLRLGQQVLRKHSSMNATKKVTRILAEAIGYEVDENAEIARLVKSLSQRRNVLVHPRPELEVWNDDGSTRKTERRVGKVDIHSAELAASEMGRFFEIFKGIDPEASQILGEF